MTVIKAEVNIKVSYKMSDGLKVDIGTEPIQPTVQPKKSRVAIGSSSKLIH